MKYLPVTAFLALGVIWGSNFVYMKLAAELISPAQIVLLRVASGFLPLAIYAYFQGALKLAHLKHTGHFVVMSLLATVIYYYGFAKGTSLLPSGVAGALSGAIPIFALLISMLLPSGEAVSIKRLLGLAAGLSGVILIARPFSGEAAATNVEGVIYMVSGSLSVGASFIYARKYIVPLNISSAALTTYQLGLSLIILCIITDYSGMASINADLHAAAGVFLGLGLLGTGLAYLIYYYLIAQWGAVSASSVTYIPPVVALLIGSILMGEDIGAIEYVATGLIVIAVMLINQKTHNTVTRPMPSKQLTPEEQ
ncbi:DMT family transporter [Zobellella maritima]|uniref:DMT family transporter n=1 Tax=Zobellella maritima TaxID=2059725 RepID=UPI000E3017C0|nr:DMT family transporter [Zobellella maritima]